MDEQVAPRCLSPWAARQGQPGESASAVGPLRAVISLPQDPTGPRHLQDLQTPMSQSVDKPSLAIPSPSKMEGSPKEGYEQTNLISAGSKGTLSWPY